MADDESTFKALTRGRSQSIPSSRAHTLYKLSTFTTSGAEYALDIDLHQKGDDSKNEIHFSL